MQSILFLFPFIVIFSSVGQIASDLYLPSLPAITLSLQTTTHLAQLSVSLFMLGYCISRIGYGPISDAFGRRKTLLCGLLICFFGTIICVSAKRIEILMLGRFIQGLGGAVSSLGGPVLRDLIEGESLAKYGAYLGMATIFFIAGAPLLGGYLQHYFDWHASFIFLLIYLSLIFALLFFIFPETNKHQSRDNIRPTIFKKNIITVMSNKAFVGNVICIFFTYANIIAWLTLGPILLQHHLGLTAIQYGWAVMCVAIIYVLGGFINSRLLGRYAMSSLLLFGLSVTIFGGVIMSVFAFMHVLTLSVIVVPMMIVMFGAGFIFPVAFSNCLMPFPKISGTAVSMIGFIQISGGFIASAIISVSPDNTQMPLAIIVLVASLLGLLAFNVFLRE